MFLEAEMVVGYKGEGWRGTAQGICSSVRHTPHPLREKKTGSERGEGRGRKNVVSPKSTLNFLTRRWSLDYVFFCSEGLLESCSNSQNNVVCCNVETCSKDPVDRGESRGSKRMRPARFSWMLTTCDA